MREKYLERVGAKENWPPQRVHSWVDVFEERHLSGLLWSYLCSHPFAKFSHTPRNNPSSPGLKITPQAIQVRTRHSFSLEITSTPPEINNSKKAKELFKATEVLGSKMVPKVVHIQIPRTCECVTLRGKEK